MTYPEREELTSDRPYVSPINIDELLPDEFFDWDKIGIREDKKQGGAPD